MAGRSLPTKMLGEVLSVIETGSRPSGGANSDTFGMPSLGGENITLDGSLDLESVRYVTSDFFSSMRSGHLKPLDVLINKDGAQTGKVAIYCGEFPQAAINEHLYLLRGTDEIRQDYLFRVLRSRNVSRAIQSFITGSAQPGLNRKFTNVLIPVPSLENQRVISEILEDLDEASRSIEKVITKYQEIHDGVAEDLIGSKYYDATANLGRYVKLDTRQINPREFTTELFAHYSIPAFDSVGGPHIEYGEQIESGKIVLSEPALLVSKLNPRKMRVQIFDRFNSIRSIASTEFMVYVPHVDDLDLRYLYHLLSGYHFARRLQAVATGTTNSHVRVKPSETLGWPVWVPSLSEQRRISRILDDIDETIQANRRQLEKLQQLRAGLAADLFSGKVRTVKE